MTLFATNEVAKLLGVDRTTLSRWRDRNAGPRYLRIGPKLIRYREDDIAEFLRSGERAGPATVTPDAA